MSDCCDGYEITIGLTDFSVSPLYTYDEETRTWSGFLPELIIDMSAVMGFKYKFVGASLTELWRGLIGPNVTAGPFRGAGTLPVVGGSLDAVIIASTFLAKSYGNVTCGTQPEVECLYDYTVGAVPPEELIISGDDANGTGIGTGPDFTRATVTAPFYTSSIGGMVKVVSAEHDMWRVFDPFSAGVWFAVLVTLVSIALMLNLVCTIDSVSPTPRGRRGARKRISGGEHAGDDESRFSRATRGCSVIATREPGGPRRGLTQEAIDVGRTALRGTATSLYHTTAVCLGGDESEWADSAVWPARLLRIALLLNVLVLVATYTANLASFFTADATTVLGPKTFDELKASTACINRGYYQPAEFYNIKHVVSPPGWPEQARAGFGVNGVNNTIIAEGQQYCYDALQSEQVDLIIGDARNVHLSHLRHCEETQEITYLDMHSFRYSFATQGSTAFGAALAVNLSKAIDLAFSDQTIDNLESEYFRKFDQCSSDSSASDLKPVSFREMTGLFIIVSIIAGTGARRVARRLSRRDIPHSPTTTADDTRTGVAMALLNFCLRGRQGGDDDTPSMLADASKSGAAGGEVMAESLAQMLARHRDEICDHYDRLALQMQQSCVAPDTAPVVARPAGPSHVNGLATDRSSTSASSAVPEHSTEDSTWPPADGPIDTRRFPFGNPCTPASIDEAAGAYESPPTDGRVAMQHRGRRRRKTRRAASMEPYLHAAEAPPVPGDII